MSGIHIPLRWRLCRRVKEDGRREDGREDGKAGGGRWEGNRKNCHWGELERIELIGSIENSQMGSGRSNSAHWSDIGSQLGAIVETDASSVQGRGRRGHRVLRETRTA